MKQFFSKIGQYGCVTVFIVIIGLIFGVFLGAIFAASYGIAELTGINKWILFSAILAALAAFFIIRNIRYNRRKASAIEAIRKNGNIHMTSFGCVDEAKTVEVLAKFLAGKDYIALLHLYEDQVKAFEISTYRKLSEESFLVEKSALDNKLQFLLNDTGIALEFFISTNSDATSPDIVEMFWRADSNLRKKFGGMDPLISYGLTMTETPEMNTAILLVTEGYEMSAIYQKDQPVFDKLFAQLEVEAVKVY